MEPSYPSVVPSVLGVTGEVSVGVPVVPAGILGTEQLVPGVEAGFLGAEQVVPGTEQVVPGVVAGLLEERLGR